MARETRSVIFLFLVTLFLLLGPGTVLWSQGFRLDWETKEVTRVGAIFLKTDPQQVTIGVGGEDEIPEERLEKQVEPSLLYSGVLFRNLLPKRYEIEVSAGENYFTWFKNLSVEPLGVNKVTHIVLLKKDALATEIPVPQLPVSWFSPLPRNNAFLVLTKTSPNLMNIDFRTAEPVQTSLFNFRALAGQHQVDKALFAGDGQSVIFLLDNRDAIFWIPERQIPNQTPSQKMRSRLASSYLQSLLTSSKTKVSSLSYFWYPTDPRLLYVVGDKAFYRVDTSQDEFRALSSSPILGFGTGQNQSYFLTREGDLFRLGQNDAAAFLFQIPLAEKTKAREEFLQEKFYQITEISEQGFLLQGKNTGALYHLEKDSLVRITPKAKIPSLSEDKTKLAFFDENNQLWIYFLQRIVDDLLVEKRTKIFLKEFSQEPENIFWWSDNWHLLLSFPGAKAPEFLEIDPRPPLNAWELPTSEITEAILDSKQNLLFAIRDGKLTAWQLK